MLIISVQALGTFDYFNIAVSLLDFIRTAGKISCSYAIPFCSNKICACVLISDLFSSLFIPSNGLLIWELGSGRWAWKLRALSSALKKSFPHLLILLLYDVVVHLYNVPIQELNKILLFSHLGFVLMITKRIFWPQHLRTKGRVVLSQECGKNK